jgi:hypothetical protein
MPHFLPQRLCSLTKSGNLRKKYALVSKAMEETGLSADYNKNGNPRIGAVNGTI